MFQKATQEIKDKKDSVSSWMEPHISPFRTKLILESYQRQQNLEQNFENIFDNAAFQVNCVAPLIFLGETKS